MTFTFVQDTGMFLNLGHEGLLIAVFFFLNSLSQTLCLLENEKYSADVVPLECS